MIVEYNIKNEEVMLIQAKGNYSLKLKKRMLKIKKLLKITRYIKWTRGLSITSRASLKLRKYIFTKTEKVAVTASKNLKANIVGSMPERIPSNNIWKLSHSVILHLAKNAFIFTPRQHTKQTIQCMTKF